jgi:hypothetical protein
MNMTRSSLCVLAAALGISLCGAAAAAPAAPLNCKDGSALQIRGDAPAAISYDVFSQLHPLSAKRLALFEGAGTVQRLPDGLSVCEVADDGVDDPSAVLVRAPRDRMSWWVSADHVVAAD